MTDSQDNAHVVVLPPFLFGGAFLVALLLQWIRPWPILEHMVTLWPGVLVLGLLVLGLGLAIMITGRRALEASGTNVNPMQPTTSIVTAGPYRFTRNPLYVGLTLFTAGLTLGFNTWWGFVLLIPVLLVLHFGVVLREERYLEQKFGDTYRQYRARVRRYL
jgi:protein-S-isoprenylcysteine O-methyltransferase Ste14